MNRMTKIALGAAASALTLALSGCWGIWGIKQPTPGRPEFRIEAEYIPDAVLVREDTTPDWPLGRYAFQRGADRLVVVTRITAFPDSNKKGAPVSDKIVERMWITVPLNTALGQELRVEDLEKDFLTGYDVSQRGAPFYIQPNKALGTITLLEERPGEVVAHLDVSVQPEQLSSWRVSDTLTLPVEPNGAWAAKPTSSRFYPVARPQATAPPPVSSRSVSPSPTTRPVASAADGTTGQAPTPPVQSTPINRVDPVAARSVQGKWEGTVGGVQYRAQFDATGRFAFRAAAGADTTTRVGTYQIKGDASKGEYVILHVERLESSGAEKPVDQPYVPLRLEWTPDGPTLDGQLTREQHVKVPFKPGTFQDMNTSPAARS